MEIPLAEKSRLLTTFITPFGRYCFNKLPFGITSAPERMSNILNGLEGDTLIFGKDMSEHDTMTRIQNAGVTRNVLSERPN